MRQWRLQIQQKHRGAPKAGKRRLRWLFRDDAAQLVGHMVRRLRLLRVRMDVGMGDRVVCMLQVGMSMRARAKLP